MEKFKLDSRIQISTGNSQRQNVQPFLARSPRAFHRRIMSESKGKNQGAWKSMKWRRVGKKLKVVSNKAEAG